MGILNETILDTDVPNFLTHAAQDDTSASLEFRAKSYLDLNCGYCHQPATGNRAVFDARLSTSLYFSGLFSDEINEPLTYPDERIIFPNDTSKSVLYQRIHSNVPGIAMPALGRNLIDSAGAALIADWIINMDSTLVNCIPENLTTGKTVSQSNTFGTGTPELAIDGNTDGDYGNGSVSQTNSGSEMWWEIDLGSVYDIKDVILWNRTDCCSDRLKDFYVLVSEDPFQSQDLSTTLIQSGVISQFFSGAAGQETSFDISASGQYVRIQKTGGGRLALAEVQILGCCPPGQICNGIANQTISLSPIPDKQTLDAPFQVSATASSGLPVSFQILSGPATISGDIITLNGTVGTVVVQASQAGDINYNPAPDVTDTFEVELPGPPTVQIVSPQDGETIEGDQIQVDVSSTGDLTGADHIELILDAGTPVALSGLSGSHIFTSVSLGAHVITAQLVDGGGTPLGNSEASETINVTTVVPTCTPTNLTANKTVSQSSIFGTGAPELAIDGNTDGNYGNGSVSQTNSESEAWWEIDLGTSYDIEDITLWNRTDCCSGRLKDFHVFVSDAPFQAQDVTTTLNQSGVVSQFFAGEAGVETIFSFNTIGRYVRVQKTGGGRLALAEVEIVGCCPQGQVCNGSANQTISLTPIPDKQTLDAPFQVSATASSGLPVSFQILSGPATILGDIITLNGTAGTVVVQASQAGDLTYNPAPDVTDTFEVELPGPSTVQIVSPQDGETIPGDQIQVDVSSTGDLTGADHIELILDAGTPVALSGLSGSHIFTSVSLGAHVITAQLVDGGGTPLGNSEASETINVTTVVPTCTPTNLTANKTVSQSSIFGTGAPELAIDGNTDGNYGNGSVSQTNSESEAWWEIDLGTSYDIEDITLWNRTDCCSGRLKDFHVFVSDAPFQAQDVTTTLNQSGVVSQFFAGEAGVETIFSFNTIGRYVRVQKTGGGRLALAEVEIVGCCPQGQVCNGSANQTISLTPIPDKQTLDAPFQVSATASSGLPVSFQILSGPATILGDIITLNGTAGTVVVQASQAGDLTYNPAPDVTDTFEVELPGPPTVQIVSPQDGETISGDQIQVDVSSTGDLTGADHIELILDAGTPVALSGLSGSHIFTSVSPGAHIIVAQLVDAGGTPLSNPEASALINVDLLAAGFLLVGDAINSSPSACYILTQDLKNQTGAAWYENQVDLNSPFDLEFDIRLGSTNGGADGMAFLLQNSSLGLSAIGGGGSDLGVTGISPSFGVEFDTHQSSSDPIGDDHVAIFANGDIANPIVAPVCITPTCDNVEDNVWRVLEVTWDPNSQQFSVYIDGNLRISYTGDIINNFFGGNALVNMGFTASTGGRDSQHEFCVTDLTFGSAQARLRSPMPLSAVAFPNPINDYFFLEIRDNPSQWVDIQIFDGFGRLVHQSREELSGKLLKIRSQFSSGIYLLQIRSGSKAHTMKLVKE